MITLATIGVLLIAVIAAGIGTSGSEPTNEAAPASQTDTPAADVLAATVWDQVESNFPDGISSSSPLFTVTDIEDVSPGTIRVFVQENLNDDGRDEIARQVYNMGAMDNAELEVVVVRDASGTDSNHYR